MAGSVRHGTLWLGALLCMVLAALVATVRLNDRPAPPDTPEATLAFAIEALSPSGSPGDRASQLALRRAAVAVESAQLQSAEAYYVVGMQFQREQDLARAEAQYRRAIGARPDWAWPYAALGNLLGRHTVGRLDEAEDQLRQAIVLTPDWARAHDSLAVILRLQGRLVEAELHAARAVKIDPSGVGPHNNRANLLVKLGRYGEAEKEYLEAIAMDVEHAKPYYNLACLYSILGRQEEALEYLKGAIGRAPVMRREAAGDPDFEALRDLPVYQRLVFGQDEAAVEERNL